MKAFVRRFWVWGAMLGLGRAVPVQFTSVKYCTQRTEVDVERLMENPTVWSLAQHLSPTPEDPTFLDKDSHLSLCCRYMLKAEGREEWNIEVFIAKGVWSNEVTMKCSKSGGKKPLEYEIEARDKHPDASEESGQHPDDADDMMLRQDAYDMLLPPPERATIVWCRNARSPPQGKKIREDLIGEEDLRKIFENVPRNSANFEEWKSALDNAANLKHYFPATKDILDNRQHICVAQMSSVVLESHKSPKSRELSWVSSESWSSSDQLFEVLTIVVSLGDGKSKRKFVDGVQGIRIRHTVREHPSSCWFWFVCQRRLAGKLEAAGLRLHKKKLRNRHTSRKKLRARRSVQVQS